MKVDKLTLERIFERDERLEAPLFQRPYVWKQEDLSGISCVSQWVVD